MRLPRRKTRMTVHHRRRLLTALIEILILHPAIVTPDGAAVKTAIIITLRGIAQRSVLRGTAEVCRTVWRTGVERCIVLPACAICGTCMIHRIVITGDTVVIIDVNVDVIILSPAMMAVIMMIVMVIIVVVMVVVIPVDAAENGIGRGDAHTKTDARDHAIHKLLPRRRRQIDRRISRSRPGAIHHIRVVARYVNDLWIGGFNNDGLLRGCAFHHGGTAALRRRFNRHFLLRCAFQRSALLRHLTEFLHGIHHVGRLRQKRVAEILYPCRIFTH